MELTNAMKVLNVKPLKGILGEYIDLGIETGLFNRQSAQDAFSRLSGIDIVEDNLLDEEAEVRFTKGRGKLYINKKMIEENPNPHHMEEVMFYELSHFTNDIFRETYVYGQNRTELLKKRFSYIGEQDPTVGDPENGMLLLDDAICRYTSKLFLDKKYKEDHVFNYKYYPENEYVAELFIASLYGKKNMARFCKEAYSNICMDTIFLKNTNSQEELYRELGYLGKVFTHNQQIYTEIELEGKVLKYTPIIKKEN